MSEVKRIVVVGRRSSVISNKAFYRSRLTPHACLDVSSDKTCFHDDPDGMNWERPALGIIPRESPSEQNFIYAAEGKAVSGAGVLWDPDDPDPARRHKLFYCTQTLDPQTAAKRDSDCRVAFSPDGVHWTPYAGNPVLHVLSDTRHGVFKDPNTGTYVCPVRLRIDPAGSSITDTATRARPTPRGAADA